MHAVWYSPAARSALLTAALLAVPAIAMQFTSVFNWGIEDFLAAGLLIFSAAWACQLAMRTGTTRPRRIMMATAVLVVAALVWAELAVGLFS